jgi:hypothetical protein
MIRPKEENTTLESLPDQSKLEEKKPEVSKKDFEATEAIKKIHAHDAHKNISQKATFNAFEEPPIPHHHPLQGIPAHQEGGLQPLHSDFVKLIDEQQKNSAYHLSGKPMETSRIQRYRIDWWLLIIAMILIGFILYMERASIFNLKVHESSFDAAPSGITSSVNPEENGEEEEPNPSINSSTFEEAL